MQEYSINNYEKDLESSILKDHQNIATNYHSKYSVLKKR